MAASRAVRHFSIEADPWPIVNSWASEKGYKRVSGGGNQVLFQKGTGFLVAPQMLQITANGGDVHLEAWIRAGLFVRLMSLFLLPAEITIESGGFKAALPRKMARSDVNDLMARLNQPALN